MKLGYVLKKCRISALLLLLLSTIPMSHAQSQPGIKNMRTVVYEPVLKDASWTKGKVVDFILFVKYDNEGRKIVENRLKPDGAPYGKLVYLYNASGQVAREIYASADEGVSDCWDYTYDEMGHINNIVFMNGEEDTLATVSALYDESGKVQKKIIRDYLKNRLTETEDTASLKRAGARRLGRMQVVKDKIENNKIIKVDEHGNWTERHERCSVDGKPEFIVCRDIVYAGDEKDWNKLPLKGKVKSVKQSSYVAIPQGPQAVDKGAKKGRFFVYQFNRNGLKTREECFSDTGKPTENISYEYDENGNLLKEIHYTPANVLTKTRTYQYDKKGRPKHCVITNEKGEKISMNIYRHDLESNLVQEVRYRTDGTKSGEFRYVYDSYGQQVERKVLFQADEVSPMNSIRRTYNFQGRIVGEEHLLLPGVGRNIYTYRHNAKGEVISGTEQLDGQPEEVKFVYKFYNDNRGNWKIRIKYVNDVPVVYEERKYEYYE